MNSAVEQLVDSILEDDHDAHVKTWERVKKWDNAHKSYQDLLVLKNKAHELYKDMGLAIGYERALAHVGLTKEDVEHPIYGSQIGATHNFKGKELAKKCTSDWCTAFGKYDMRPLDTGETEKGACPNCGEIMSDASVGITPSRLRGRYARHMLGVQTKDGHYVWFKEPVLPR